MAKTISLISFDTLTPFGRIAVFSNGTWSESSKVPSNTCLERTINQVVAGDASNSSSRRHENEKLSVIQSMQRSVERLRGEPRNEAKQVATSSKKQILFMKKKQQGNTKQKLALTCSSSHLLLLSCLATRTPSDRLATTRHNTTLSQKVTVVQDAEYFYRLAGGNK